MDPLCTPRTLPNRWRRPSPWVGDCPITIGFTMGNHGASGSVLGPVPSPFWTSVFLLDKWGL